MRTWLAVLAACALPGCYLSHPIDGDDPPDGASARDGGQADDGGVPPRRDGGPVDGGPMRFDGGPMRIDGGPMRFDGGPMRIDGGPMRFDGGPMRIDGGPMRIDGGPIRFDGGPMRVDGGPMRVDGGPMRIDGGPTRFDGGPTRIDGGPMRIDGGPTRIDGGPMRIDGGPMRFDGGPTRIDAGRDAGMMMLDAGPARPALRFNRTTFMFVGDAPTFDIPEDSTFEVWVRSRERGDIDFCGKGNSLARDLIVGQRGGRLVAGWQVAGIEYLINGPEMPFDEWVHVALVRDADADGRHTARLYVNGELLETAFASPQLVRSFNDIDFRCGFANVDVDELRLWRVARSTADITANYARRISGGIPGLMHYWRLDERGQILTDYTPMGRVGINGTLTTPDPADGTWILDGAI